MYIFTEPTELKLIILYIIKNFNMPIDNGQITDIFMSHTFVDYFTMQGYIDEMEEDKLIEIHAENEIRKYYLTDRGKEALEYFINRIPRTVRERVLLSIKTYQKKLRNQIDITAEFHEVNELEYGVDCTICESGKPLFSVFLSTGSKESAKDACRRFKENPEKVYSELLRVLLSD